MYLVPDMYVARNNIDNAVIGLNQEGPVIVNIRSHPLNHFVVLHYCNFAAQNIRSFFPFLQNCIYSSLLYLYVIALNVLEQRSCQIKPTYGVSKLATYRSDLYPVKAR